MRLVLLHYHLFKNAGTTIEDMLAHSFGDFARWDTNDRDALISNVELLAYLKARPSVQALSSHQIRYPVPREPGFLFFDICFLRDPLDRVRSSYDYFRAKPAPGDTVSDLANRLPLGEFTRSLVDDAPWFVNDAQVNTIANGVCNDPPSQADLELATERLMQTSFLGVVDRFEDSLRLAKFKLAAAFPTLQLSRPAANTSTDLSATLTDRLHSYETECGQETWSRLLDLNRLDLELVSRVRRSIEEQLREI